jgi:prophage regulatory protein
MAPPGRIYTLKTLPEKGITYSSVHLHRLIRAGKFPPPFYMSERRPAWTEATLDEWITKRQAKREVERAEYERKRQAEREAKRDA